MPEYFRCGPEAVAHLTARDPVLGRAIERIGPVRREVQPDLFESLVRSIIAQQISAKAARTVFDRLATLLPDLTPQAVVQADVAAIQGCGMSLRKATYLSLAAEAVLSGTVDLVGLADLPDDAVRAALSSIKGIGLWTADMLMTFCLQRPDVISFHDLAIRRGMALLYHHRAVTPAIFERHRRRYSPHATLAALYLWEIAGRQT
ncbi:MAG: DNA-3-methyladenine glycosylase 2 family protein [Bifidobacteriaceae bacterium]|jgi:DNA-3-methyladenine glycosylase II|nr:DNA-3-methyladenine glycosylase 2 family protein [Bifidobacteriaceae bacterium]